MLMETVGHKTVLELHSKTYLQRSPKIKPYNGSILLVLQNPSLLKPQKRGYLHPWRAVRLVHLLTSDNVHAQAFSWAATVKIPA